MTEPDLLIQPIRFRVDMPLAHRPRLKALARPLLLIPHMLMVGGPAFCFVGVGFLKMGALGALAWLAAVFDWFAILFHQGTLPGLQPYKRAYLQWRARALAYGAFLRDEYPPFGEGSYPVTLDLQEAPAARDKTSVFFRPLSVLPHLLWLFLLLLVWSFVGLFSWLWISITGSLPEPVWRFSRNVMGYSLRVEAYALLMYDAFPAFSLSGEGESPAPSAAS